MNYSDQLQAQKTSKGALGGVATSVGQAIGGYPPPYQPQPCPSCGYCPHCGRSNSPYPSYPYVPSVTWGGTGQTSQSNLQSYQATN